MAQEKMEEIYYEFARMKFENEELVKKNEELEKYTKILEGNMLKLLEDIAFYEGVFEETKPEPKAPPLGVGKMKKSVGKNKPYTSREPRYHMTEVARDWAS